MIRIVNRIMQGANPYCRNPVSRCFSSILISSRIFIRSLVNLLTCVDNCSRAVNFPRILTYYFARLLWQWSAWYHNQVSCNSTSWYFCSMTNKAKNKTRKWPAALCNSTRVQVLGNPLTLQINSGKSIIFKVEHTSKFRFGMYTETVKKSCH